MRQFLLPHSVAGWLAAALFSFFAILVILQLTTPWPLPGFAIGMLGLAAMIVALVAILRARERSVWAFLVVAGGVLVLAWIVGEILWPH